MTPGKLDGVILTPEKQVGKTVNKNHDVQRVKNLLGVKRSYQVFIVSILKKMMLSILGKPKLYPMK